MPGPTGTKVPERAIVVMALQSVSLRLEGCYAGHLLIRFLVLNQQPGLQPMWGGLDEAVLKDDVGPYILPARSLTREVSR